MKPLVIALLIITNAVIAGEPPATPFPKTFRTLDGTEYNEVTVQRITSESISILHADGTATLQLTSLPEELRKRFNYDPQIADSARKANGYHAVPKGGVINVTIERSTIDAADLQYFTFIVESAGKEILRQSGSPNIANTPVGDRRWWNIKRLELPEFSGPLNIRVVDRFSTTTADFILHPPAK